MNQLATRRAMEAVKTFSTRETCVAAVVFYRITDAGMSLFMKLDKNDQLDFIFEVQGYCDKIDTQLSDQIESRLDIPMDRDLLHLFKTDIDQKTRIYIANLPCCRVREDVEKKLNSVVVELKASDFDITHFQNGIKVGKCNPFIKKFVKETTSEMIYNFCFNSYDRKLIYQTSMYQYTRSTDSIKKKLKHVYKIRDTLFNQIDPADAGHDVKVVYDKREWSFSQIYLNLSLILSTVYEYILFKRGMALNVPIEIDEGFTSAFELMGLLETWL
jgi:hypothetical protein